MHDAEARAAATGYRMKKILLATFALAISSSAGQAVAASPRAEGAHFAAMSLTKDQGARAIISNVLVPADGAHLAPCQVRVSFFGADGSPIGNTTTVQLRAGESTSVPAAQPSKLVRATVIIGDVADPAEVCALRTSVEIFDVQTGITFVSVPGEPVGIDTECSVSAIPAPRPKHKNASSRKTPAPQPRTRSPELQTTPSTAPDNDYRR